MAQYLADTLQPIEGLDGGQDMGREGRVRIDGAERIAHAYVGIPLGERSVGHLDGLFSNAITGRRGQRHQKPPVVGCDSTGYGTTHASHHTGDVRHWNRIAP